MKSLAKLVHKTYTTYLPTVFPAHYYGMPNGKIYLVYSRLYKVAFGKAGLEFIFAVHEEFLYDYENEKLLSSDNTIKRALIFAETIDKPHPKIKIIKIKRTLNSYGEALNFINKKAEKMKRYA